MLGDLVASAYQYGYHDSISTLDKAEELGMKSVAQDPNCQVAHFTMALVHFLKGQKNDFLMEAEKTLRLNSNHALLCAALALHIAMVGEWERGIELMKRAMRLNPHHPGWYYLVDYLNFYRQGEYELALIEAGRFNISAFYWDPLIRAAVQGQLNQQAEAEKSLNELLDLIPDFKQRGKDLIRRFAYSDEHVEMIWDGLQKAGIEK
jgi:tetratricopeptide (TPR) repeat protein